MRLLEIRIIIVGIIAVEAVGLDIEVRTVGAVDVGAMVSDVDRWRRQQCASFQCNKDQ